MWSWWSSRWQKIDTFLTIGNVWAQQMPPRSCPRSWTWSCHGLHIVHHMSLRNYLWTLQTKYCPIIVYFVLRRLTNQNFGENTWRAARPLLLNLSLNEWCQALRRQNLHIPALICIATPLSKCSSSKIRKDIVKTMLKWQLVSAKQLWAGFKNMLAGERDHAQHAPRPAFASPPLGVATIRVCSSDILWLLF